MAKQKKQAMVKYNESNDSFELYIRCNEKAEWGFSRSTKCRSVEDEVETNFIHFSFLREVLRCIELGYDVFEGRN